MAAVVEDPNSPGDVKVDTGPGKTVGGPIAKTETEKILFAIEDINTKIDNMTEQIQAMSEYLALLNDSDTESTEKDPAN